MFQYILDPIEKRMYWINYNGDIKAVNADGSDVKTLVSINSKKIRYAIGVLDNYIYYHADNRMLVMRNKSQIFTRTVVYTALNSITSIYAFNAIGT